MSSVVKMKKYWPVPKSYSRKVPKDGGRGAFKINDYYRKLKIWHTGIDIICPPGSEVLAVEDCKVLQIGQFTGAPDSPQYRKTWFVMVENSGNVAVYGELRKPRLAVGRKVKTGNMLGFIAMVEWARNSLDKNGRSTLHFELYKKGTRTIVDWWPKSRPKPSRLLDPTKYLEAI